jgi:hypothetical protein
MQLGAHTPVSHWLVAKRPGTAEPPDCSHQCSPSSAHHAVRGRRGGRARPPGERRLLLGLRSPFQPIAPAELLPAGDWPTPQLATDGSPTDPVMVTLLADPRLTSDHHCAAKLVHSVDQLTEHTSLSRTPHQGRHHDSRRDSRPCRRCRPTVPTKASLLAGGSGMPLALFDLGRLRRAWPRGRAADRRSWRTGPGWAA